MKTVKCSRILLLLFCSVYIKEVKFHIYNSE